MTTGGRGRLRLGTLGAARDGDGVTVHRTGGAPWLGGCPVATCSASAGWRSGGGDGGLIEGGAEAVAAFARVVAAGTMSGWALVAARTGAREGARTGALRAALEPIVTDRVLRAVLSSRGRTGGA